MNFTITVNGKKMRVKGLKGIKDLATGKTSMAEAAANAEGANVTLVEPALAGKMKLLSAKDRKTVKAGEALIGKTLLCQVTTKFHDGKVGDRDSKPGLRFMKSRTISKLYSSFYCRVAPGSDSRAILYTFIPMPFAKAVKRVEFGGQVNIKILGQVKKTWYGELAGIVALDGKP